jgi:putative ABC transport system permease protein
MRSALTLLGILIGIAAVMLTVGLGQGASAQITAQINSLGSNMLIVTPGGNAGGGGGGMVAFRGGMSADKLSLADAQALAQEGVAPDVAAIAPVATAYGNLRSPTTTWQSQLVGTVPDWAKVRARELSSGRFFTDSEVAGGESVVVLGTETATQLFADAALAVGKTIQIDGQIFTVIGVLDSTGYQMSSNEDDTVLLPITTYSDRFASGSTDVNTIYLEAASGERLSAAQQQVNKALLTLHRLSPENADFSVTTQASLVSTMESVVGILTAVLGGIAAISLLVGGIGVMNIMLVSVSERVHEIGLRKALGATPSTIRQQFLVEAAVLGFVGGLLGVLLGVGGSALVAPLIGVPAVLSIPATAIALAVSFAIGLIAGVYPAGRAAKMAPIDALRNE